MKPSTSHQIVCSSQPLVSSQTLGWQNIVVEEFHHPAGEGRMLFPEHHVICLSLAPRPVQLLQFQGSKSYSGLYRKGDISITPAQAPLFARWESDDRLLQIRIASRFIEQIAEEALAMNPDRLEVRPEFRTRNAQLEAIAMLLRTELNQNNLGDRLYIDSLNNALVIKLLRQYSTARPQLSIFEGGLSQRQLLQVSEYIHEHLDHSIRLADLAGLLGMSQFHFSHMFKQAIGISPYQYLIQQRIERVKLSLTQCDRSIMDIALECGFNSHSHLSKTFRQYTGMTPKAYRNK